MTKAIPSALLAHYRSGDATLAHGLKITRRDGAVFAFTSHHRRATIGGVVYSAAQGLDVSGIVTSLELEVGNLELQTLNDGSLFTDAEIFGGAWQGAAFLLLRYNWDAPQDGADPLFGGVVGNVTLREGEVVAELRDLKQYLQQPVGSASSKTCRVRLGSPRCGVSLPGSPGWTHAGTVTASTGAQVFSASALVRPDDYFGEGEVLWVTGANAGLRSKVKTHTNSGGAQITLMLPMPAAIAVGDTFSAVAGCRKRYEEDCIGKFGNGLNFQGEPHRRGTDALVAPPDVEA